MKSSYIENSYDEIFRAIISAFQPLVCVELGVLAGFSTIAIAKALKTNVALGCHKGHVYAFDAFDDYPYTHVSRETAQMNVEEADVADFVTIEKADAFQVFEKFAPNSVSFLHVDLSNTGKTVRTVMEQWDSRMVQGGVICFEGGSEERDNIEWMQKYQAESIKKELETNPIIEEKYVFGTYFPFPSLTCLLKKR